MRQRIFSDFLRARVDFRKPVREKFAHPNRIRPPIGHRSARSFFQRRRGIRRETEICRYFAVFVGDFETLRNYRVQEHVVDLARIGVDVRHAVSARLRNPDIAFFVGREVIICFPRSSRIVRIFSGEGIQFESSLAVRRPHIPLRVQCYEIA